MFNRLWRYEMTVRVRYENEVLRLLEKVSLENHRIYIVEFMMWR